MLKISCFCVLVLLVAKVCYTEARPPQLKRPVQNSSKVNTRRNNSNVTFIKKLSENNISRDANNKTKTRILFRGELVGEFNDQDIIFPDTYQIIFEDIPRIEGPPKCAKGSTFCEDYELYPHYQVKNILQRNHLDHALFGQDEEPPHEIYGVASSIANRNKITDNEFYFCASSQKTIFPKIGKNKNNKWKYIINQDEPEGYIQGVRIEICRKEGPCDLIGELPEGYTTTCKQKFMLRRLMSLSDNGDPVQDTFQLPSACCCSYKRDISFLYRSAGPDITVRTRGRG